MSLKTSKILISGISAIVLVLTFWMSLRTIRCCDDYFYQYNFATSENLLDYNADNVKIASITDIFESQIAHYNQINGRFVAHFILQFILIFFSHTGYAFINSLMFLALIFIIAKLGNCRFDSFSQVFVVFLLSILCFDTFYIAACQINYIWMGVLSFGFVLIYLNNSNNDNIFFLLGLFIFSLIAGNAQEAYNIGIGGALIIYNIAHFKKIRLKQWVMFFGFAIGGLLLCLAPGTLHRAGTIHLSPFYTIHELILYPKITYIFLITIIFYKIKYHIDIKAYIKDNLFYVSIFLVSLIFNVALGVFGNRQLFGMEVAALVLLLRLLKIQDFNWVVKFILTITIIYVYYIKISNIEEQRKVVFP